MTTWELARWAGVAPSAIRSTAPGSVRVDVRRVEHNVEAAARAVEAPELPTEFADQLREPGGYA
jgi:hypothetical protein